MPETAATDDRSTCIVELTPVGRGGIAVLLVAGPGAIAGSSSETSWRAVVGACRYAAESDRFGNWGGANGEELVVCRRDEEQIEVHCHGGVAAIRSCRRLGFGRLS